jgi:hypothetical protein
MGQLLRSTAAALKGGGAKIIGKQVKRTTDGTGFTALTGTDCLGATAGTWHEFGSIETFDIPRAADGTHTLTPTLIEWDTDRRNLLIHAAPFDAASSSGKLEELDLEDGTVIESSSATGEDSTLPYWQIIYRGTPMSTGKESAFFCCAQLNRAGGPGTTKANSYTKPKISFVSIASTGSYTCTAPAASGPDAWVDGITPPTLTGATTHGVWVEAT